MRNMDRGAIIAVCVLLLAAGALLWAVVGIVRHIEFPAINLRGAVQDTTDAGGGNFDDIGNQTVTPNVNVGDGVRTIDGARTIEIEGFFWQGMVRGTDLYFYYVMDVFSHVNIYVRRINVDLAVPEVVAVLEWLPSGDAWPHVVALDVTDEGGFRLLIWDRVFDGDPDAVMIGVDNAAERLFYAEFDVAGNLTFKNELPAVREAIVSPFEMSRVVFADTGDILVKTWRSDVIYILDADGSLRAEVTLEYGFGHMAHMRDGRVVVAQGEGFGEVDLAAGTLGAMQYNWFPDHAWIVNLYSAQMGSPFDLYAELQVWPEAYFYGFDLSDMSWTRLIEVEDRDRWSLFTEFLADGRLVILEWDMADRGVTYIHILYPNH